MSVERIDLHSKYNGVLECIVFDGGTVDESIRIKEPSTEFYASGDRIETSEHGDVTSVNLWSGFELVTSVTVDEAMMRRFEVELGRSSADYLAD